MRLAQSVDRDFSAFWIASASQVPTSCITHFFTISLYGRANWRCVQQRLLISGSKAYKEANL